MHAILFTDVCRALYGDGWVTPLSQDFGIGPRALKRFANGQNDIPRGVWSDIITLISDRVASIERIAAAAPDGAHQRLNERRRYLRYLIRRIDDAVPVEV